MAEGMRDGGLRCPGCGAVRPLTERFCEECALPLVHERAPALERAASARRRAARKVDPRYAEGEPVKVLGARNQAEAELIQGLLLEEGIPSMLRTASSSFLPFGHSDVYVPAAALQAAREALLRAPGRDAG